jgi:hypothetical protein
MCCCTTCRGFLGIIYIRGCSRQRRAHCPALYFYLSRLIVQVPKSLSLDSTFLSLPSKVSPMEKDVLTRDIHTSGAVPPRFRRSNKRVWPVLAVLVLAALYLSTELAFLPLDSHRTQVHVPLHAAETLARCRSLNLKPLAVPAAGFSSRSQSDRYEPGTKSVLIRNASIWTGLQDGTDVVHGDILLEQGIITAVGDLSWLVNLPVNKDVTGIDAKVCRCDTASVNF